MVLYEGAMINSGKKWIFKQFLKFSNLGYVISDPADFSKRFYRLFNGALGIPRNAPIEEVKVDLEDDDEDEDDKKGKFYKN